MILEGKKVSVESSRMKDSVDFTAEIDGMMFDNLINGIYSNKMAAGIREYATNARDGHARAGNLDKPFDVSLPTRGNPTFEVRDYGSSLSHKDVFEVYTVLGKSTKRDTNEETGCLGLGSKSAFAYTNTFTVTCYKDGEKRDYVCYIAEDGRPKASLMHTTKTREPDGVRISYAVKQEDVEAFNKEATQQLRGFDPQPNVLRHTESYKPLNNNNLLLEGDGWKLYKGEEKTGYYSYQDSGKPYAIQGSVAYPIEWSNQALQSAVHKLDKKYSSKVAAMLRRTNVLIKFELGELRMTTSREELAYDEKTCKNIAEKCQKVIDQIQEKLDEDYKKCKTLKDARILLAKNRADEGMSQIDNILGIHERYWKGTRIKERIDVASNDYGSGEVDSIQVDKYGWGVDVYAKPDIFVKRHDGVQFRIEHEFTYRNKFGEMKASFKWKDRNVTTATSREALSCHKVSDLKVVVQVDDDIEGNLNSLMRRFWVEHAKGSDRFMWIQAKSKAEAKAFLEDIYHDQKKVWYLDELEELKMVKTTTVVNGQQVVADTQKQFRVIYPERYVYSSDSNKYKRLDSSNPPKDKVPYVWFYKNEFFWTKEDMEKQQNGLDHQRLANYLYEWVKTGDVVYVVNQMTKAFFEANPNMFTPAKEWMIKTWKENNKTWEQDYIDRNKGSEVGEDEKWGKAFKSIKRKTGLTFPKIDGILDKYKDNSTNTGYHNAYRSGDDGLPLNANVWMKAEVEAVKKKALNQNLKTECLDYVKSDPVLKYLVGEFDFYRNNEDLVDALKHWHKNNT